MLHLKDENCKYIIFQIGFLRKLVNRLKIQIYLLVNWHTSINNVINLNTYVQPKVNIHLNIKIIPVKRKFDVLFICETDTMYMVSHNVLSNYIITRF